MSRSADDTTRQQPPRSGGRPRLIPVDETHRARQHLEGFADPVAEEKERGKTATHFSADTYGQANIHRRAAEVTERFGETTRCSHCSLEEERWDGA